MTRCARAGAAWHDEFRVVPAPGQTTWLMVSAQPAAQPDGAVLWQGWLMDVSDRRRAQLALADCEQRHRQLFDANPMPMWVHDRLTLSFLAVNNAAIERYGWSREEFLAMSLVDLRHPGAAGCASRSPRSGAAACTARCCSSTWTTSSGSTTRAATCSATRC
jgi:PAS domain-containing protein